MIFLLKERYSVDSTGDIVVRDSSLLVASEGDFDFELEFESEVVGLEGLNLSIAVGVVGVHCVLLDFHFFAFYIISQHR